MSSILLLAENVSLGGNIRDSMRKFGPPYGKKVATAKVMIYGDSVMADSGARFDLLAECIEKAAGDSRSSAFPAVVVADKFDLAGASPLRNGTNSDLARLILAFPEVWWVFSDLQGLSSPLCKRHSLSALENEWVDPILDGAGLRDAIRGRMCRNSETSELVGFDVPLRPSTAVALDDEVSYAYFNAYTAYRFGFRSYPVCRFEIARILLGEDGAVRPQVTFEDVFLSYPDNPSDVHLSDLGDSDKGRKRLLKCLEKASYRIFVTTEHRHGGDNGKYKRNRAYIQSPECVQDGLEPNRYGRLVHKPYSGMHDLWVKSGLSRRLIGKDGARRGMAPGFVWPPPKNDGSEGDSGHSAPGRLLQVATHMLRRCEQMLKAGVHNVPDAVRCAVLATDALELLGDRTPTTAMDALVLKHVAEVTAECQFSGVEYNIEIRPRLNEIKCEARSLSRWFNPRRQAMAAMNAEMTTLIELIRVFRQYGQFDEALICQNRVRYLHNRLWMRQFAPRFLLWPVLKYIEAVLSSFGRFMVAIVLWVALFSALFALLSQQAGGAAASLPAGCIGSAFNAFFRAGGEFSANVWRNILLGFAILLGSAHMGIFFSHMYMLVNRKD